MSWSRGAAPCTSEAARGHFIEGWAEFAMHKLGGEAAHFPHLEGRRPCPPRDQGSRNTLSANPKLGGSCGFSGRPLSRSVPSAVLYFRSRHSQVPRAPSLFPDQRPPTPRCPCTSAQGPRSGAHPGPGGAAGRAAGAGARRAGRGTPGERGAQAVDQGAGFAPGGSVLLLQFREILGRLGNGLSVSILTATCCSRPGGWSAEGSGGEASREASSGPFAPVRLCITWGWTSGLALLSRAWRRDSRASVCHPPPPGIPSPMRSRPCSFLQNIPVEMTQTLLLNPGIIVMSFLAGLAWDPPSPGGLSPHPEHVATTCKPPGPGKGARAGP